jgi:hypothetical protein
VRGRVGDEKRIGMTPFSTFQRFCLSEILGLAVSDSASAFWARPNTNRWSIWVPKSKLCRRNGDEVAVWGRETARHDTIFDFPATLFVWNTRIGRF